ncbi:hypothetical protein [Nocardia iowensis]|uniref:Uncharacterized protein n=1 Tax=Nocardia iowensis TaxID=204891 RepID=A0ABX8RQX0_NOCIO|nr:hypothetical protein [Nocardia iowensis]QXN91407.1 hypothetical protein KV110_39900 [Nocardia iowensis]
MSDRSATAATALEHAVRNVPRLAGFSAWRPGISGIPYLSGDEPHAVVVVLIHDPRDARVRSATLVATPDPAAPPIDDERRPR